MRPRHTALAVAVAVLLVAATAAAVTSNDGGGSEGGDRPSGGASRPSELRSDFEQAIDEARAFVAETRGRDFLRPVEVELLEGEAFRERLLEDVEEDRAEVDVDQRVLQALGLIDPGVDLFDMLVDFIGGSVVGFYDPETDALVVRARELTPYARTTLVHELTHALDDQHFELHREELEVDDSEALFAFHALVEGNAVRVEAAFEESMTPEERQELAEEERRLQESIDISDVPVVVRESIGFPYAMGPLFVRALVAVGGEARVDDAFRVPPVTSEHIIDPDAWLEGEPVIDVPPPDAGGEIVDEGSYGLWAILLTLLDELGEGGAGQAALGWGGDAYVAWDEPTRTCVRAQFAMDTPADLEELDRALQAWSRAHPDAQVERERDRVGFVACG